MFANITISPANTRVEVEVDTIATRLHIVHPLNILTITLSTQLQSSSFCSYWKEDLISLIFHILHFPNFASNPTRIVHKLNFCAQNLSSVEASIAITVDGDTLPTLSVGMDLHRPCCCGWCRPDMSMKSQLTVLASFQPSNLLFHQHYKSSVGLVMVQSH